MRDERPSLLAERWNRGDHALRESITGEPRGALCAMGSCFECRVTLDGLAHVRACMVDGSPPLHAEVPARCEVAVVGGGPAGIAAATVAAEHGATTLLLDESARPGGQIWRHRGEAPKDARSWLDRLARSGAKVASGATVFDATTDGERALFVDLGGRTVKVAFEQLILATGARERFLPFPGWTLPNVVGVGGAQALVKAGADFTGRRVVLGGTGPLLLAVAALLTRAGAEVLCVLEQAPASRLAQFGWQLARSPRRLLDAMRYRLALSSTPYLTGGYVVRAEGDGRVEEVILRARGGDTRLRCDVLAVGFGLVPNLELPRHLGCTVSEGFVTVDQRQETSRASVFCAGETIAIGGAPAALIQGEIAARAATGAEIPRALLTARDRERRFADRLKRAFDLRPELRALATPDTIICRCEDVRARAIDPAWSARQAKLYTRVGMGPCQGRVCGPALEFLHGWSADSVRPPLKPVTTHALEVEA